MIRKVFALATVIALLAPVASCLDEPVRPDKEKIETTWPDMTERDELIEALMWCYDNPGRSDVMEKYEGLLHPDFFFMLAPADLIPEEPAYFTRAEDIEVTRALFEIQNELALEIVSSGEWYELQEIEGQPCADCWETTRFYYVMAQLGLDDTIYRSSWEDTDVMIVVAPDVSDPARWSIRAVYDLAR